VNKGIEFGNALIMEPGLNIVSSDELDYELKVTRFSSIYEINRETWDSINKNIFNNYDFLRSIEEAAVEESKLYYLLFYVNERIIGSAVLSSFNISLDLLAGSSFQKFVKGARKYYPSFFKVRFLFCGTPISIGKNNICLIDPTYKNDFIRLLSREMSDLAEAEGIKMQCIKELFDEEVKDFNGFSKYNYLSANTIPYMKLDIRWKDFRSYINDMRYSYRRQIKDGLRKIGIEEPVFYLKDQVKPDHPYLLISNASETSPEQFHALYMQVMRRAKNKLEILNKEFFENFFNNMHPKAEIISLLDEDEILGSGLITQENDKMTFLLIGFDYAEARVYDTYFNIVYGIIALAIRRGCLTLDMGQTSYYFKQRCGATSADMFMLIKSDNKLIHMLLKIFRNIIFPKVKLPEYNIFRKD
jgi:predicted N-acyltransferase